MYRKIEGYARDEYERNMALYEREKKRDNKLLRICYTRLAYIIYVCLKCVAATLSLTSYYLSTGEKEEARSGESLYI